MAKFSLSDIKRYWKDPAKANLLQDFFTPEKLTYYFLQMMTGMLYLHRKNMYYGDMKEANLLIFRDQRVKMGDFGTLIQMSNGENDEFELKGMTVGYTTEKIKELFDS